MNRETFTTPYINLLQGTNLAAYAEEYSQLCSSYHEAGLKPVAFLKSILGRQDYCFTGEFRYWVWEREAPDLLGDKVGWRVYVSNQRGISFEVDAGATPFQARQAWLHFQEVLGKPRVLPYLDVFEERVRLWAHSVAEGSWYISHLEHLQVVDDEDPEGGVLVNATYRIKERRDVAPEKIRGWVESHLEDRLPLGAKRKGYKIEFEGTNFDGTDLVHVAFDFPGFSLRCDNYVALAYRIWKAKGDYEDEVIAIRERSRYLETERRSNRNPTTMAPFSLDRNLGVLWPIRHHGEHAYLTKHLLKLAETV